MGRSPLGYPSILGNWWISRQQLLARRLLSTTDLISALSDLGDGKLRPEGLGGKADDCLSPVELAPIPLSDQPNGDWNQETANPTEPSKGLAFYPFRFLVTAEARSREHPGH